MANIHPKRTRWLVFGDSIAEGFFDTQGGWVDRLKQSQMTRYIKEGAGVKVFNLGISGQTSSDLLMRIESELQARKSPKHSMTVLVAIGANDSALEDGKPRMSAQRYKETIGRIIAIIRRYTHDIVLIGLLPVDEQQTSPVAWGNNLSFANSRIMQFDEVLQEVSQDEKVGYVALAPLFQSDMLPTLLTDGVHPNDEGHKIIYNKVWKELEE